MVVEPVSRSDSANRHLLLVDFTTSLIPAVKDPYFRVNSECRKSFAGVSLAAKWHSLPPTVSVA